MSFPTPQQKRGDLRHAAEQARREAAGAGSAASRTVMNRMATYYDEQADALEPTAEEAAPAGMNAGKERMMKHIIEERGILVGQANMFATDDAHRIETRNGEMEDVSEERLDIMRGQIEEIDSIIDDPECQSES